MFPLGIGMSIALLCLFATPLFAQQQGPQASARRISSPDGKVTVDFDVSAAGSPTYAVRFNGQPLLQTSHLGLIRDDCDFSKSLTLLSQTGPTPVTDHYEMLTAKRRDNTYRGTRTVFHLQADDGQKVDIIFQLSNDGVAFRYDFPETSVTLRTITEEVTSFHFLPGTTAWLQPMQVAKSGYESSNPAYEEYYAKGIPVGTPSTLGAGWVFPALFHCGDAWIVLTESALGRNYCGARLRDRSPDGEYSIGFPDPREKRGDGPVNPQSVLPWLSPWRIIAIGNLRTIMESTLGTDLAARSTAPPDPSIRPGKASWSWPLLGDKNTTFDVQKRFIDFAADMDWEYCLIDARWDEQIGYERMGELARYAAGKKIGLLLWYNSAGDWNTVKQTPRDKLLTHESRIAEFARLKAMGIKGVKIDFFGGDGQSMIDYYLDLLDDARPYGLLMNFHGATLPRGWQRTYPHLMTMEAVKGFEYITFDQENADEEPSDATILPFTRNLFDPMDFTPVCLEPISPHIQRRTTVGFELALSIIFTSGIQHYVDTPEGLAKVPDGVRDFLRHVPAVWDDTRFITGFPGKEVVLARRGDGHWYLGGINGEATEKHLVLDLHALPASEGALITDGPDGFVQSHVALAANKKFEVTLRPNGGFVVVFN